MADYANLHFKNYVPDRHQQKDVDGKSSPIKSTSGTRTGWFCESTVDFTNGYHNWSPSGKILGKTFTG